MPEFLDTLIAWATNTGLKILISLVLLLISFRVITVVIRKLRKRAEKNGKFDKTLASVFFYLLNLVLRALVVICLIGYLGIDTSGLTALVASLGVCAGLAVNGALSNLAGGALLLITRPFRVDDFIEAQGFSGTVEDIHIVNTKLRTVDNKVVYIPNGALSSGTIVNYSEKDLRRVDLTFSTSYNEDFEKPKALIAELCQKHELILDDPAPFIRVSAHGASSVDIVTCVWVKSADYWTVYFDLLEGVKKAFDENGIEIPYNQLDVHVKND
ncbi:MAG: mechanosensitive ion channel [Clostridia bacterium]|nr:mechanosensitive ion channel [Clostridia bacterium]